MLLIICKIKELQYSAVIICIDSDIIIYSSLSKSSLHAISKEATTTS